MRLWLIATLLVSASALSGCGSSGPKSNGEAAKTPTQIVADAQAAALAASAVHISGSGVSGGSPLALDLKLVAGKGGSGSVTVNGLSFDIVVIGAKAYFKGGAAFWKHFGGTAAAQLFEGRWLGASATKGDLASFTPLTNLATLVKQILSSHGTLKNNGTTKVGDQSVIAIVDTSKGGTLYVAATGTPYPVQLTSKGKGGTITFDGWDQPTALVAPKGAIDYTKLSNG